MPILFRGAGRHVLYIRRIKIISGIRESVDWCLLPGQMLETCPPATTSSDTRLYQTRFTKPAPLPP